METAETTVIGTTRPAPPGLPATTVIVPTTAVAERHASLLNAIRNAGEQGGVGTQFLVVVYGQRFDRALLDLLRSLEDVNVIVLRNADLPGALLAGQRLVKTEYSCVLHEDGELRPNGLAGSDESSIPECERMTDLLRLVSGLGGSVLDVGARDGYFSRRLALQFNQVTALDLVQPNISDPRIACVKGDATNLHFDSGAFDLVVCTEVLEHVSPLYLSRACYELARVSRSHLLVGVPYRQDTRVGRTTCSSCGACNPPWGHVNVFDEDRLHHLFSGLVVERTTFVGMNDDSTNFVSAFLMDLAGNPYGTYHQDEPCVRCGGSVGPPRQMPLSQKLLSKAAFCARAVTAPFQRARPNWIHLLLRQA